MHCHNLAGVILIWLPLIVSSSKWILKQSGLKVVFCSICRPCSDVADWFRFDSKRRHSIYWLPWKIMLVYNISCSSNRCLARVWCTIQTCTKFFQPWRITPWDIQLSSLTSLLTWYEVWYLSSNIPLRIFTNIPLAEQVDLCKNDI